VIDPVSVLFDQMPPPPDASFFQRARFLLGGADVDSAVQPYTTVERLNESRVSIVRGRVLTSSGAPRIGVRVADNSDFLRGFTLTRAAGEFDLLVNGGGSVQLQFIQKLFSARLVSVYIPAQQIVTIDDVILFKKEVGGTGVGHLQLYWFRKRPHPNRISLAIRRLMTMKCRARH
jgi:hypothetical protein